MTNASRTKKHFFKGSLKGYRVNGFLNIVQKGSKSDEEKSITYHVLFCYKKLHLTFEFSIENCQYMVYDL